MRRLITVAAALVSLLAFAGAAGAQGTLRIGMTASDIPYSGGQPDNGFEGFRFVGYQIFEPLIAWDLTRSDRPAPLAPGLAESWEVRKGDPTKWVFKLRKNVKFHDGSPFTADAVVFTFAATPGGQATFDLQPDQIGASSGTVTVTGGTAVHIKQFVYP